MTHATESEAFGFYTPSPLTRMLINFCHNADGPLTRRSCAPIIRKWVTKSYTSKPLDLSLPDFNMRCFLFNNHSEKKFVFTPWRYDTQERAILRDALKGGGTFIDIGANAGIYSLTAASAMASTTGHIVAIEPNPIMMSRLKANVAANSNLFGENITLDLIPMGVADKEHTFKLKVNPENLGASSIAKKACIPNSDHETSITIACQSLMTILTNIPVKTGIDVIKIDIEGAEDIALAPFLNEAPPSLLPKIIIIENSQHLWSIDLYALIISKGYHEICNSRLNTVFQKQHGTESEP